MRFFTNPHKPMILALARPDPKKNITTLLRAFGERRPLRELANLVHAASHLLDLDTNVERLKINLLLNLAFFMTFLSSIFRW